MRSAALDDVEGKGALVAGNAVDAMVVEEELADPKGAQLADAEAAASARLKRCNLEYCPF